MAQKEQVNLPDPADLLPDVATALALCGGLLRAEFHRPGGPRGAGSTAPIDTEIEEILKRRLLSLHACDWHGEELPRVDTGHPDVWVVDPHDGTKAFLNGERGSSISIALLRAGHPIVAMVYAPTAPDDGGDYFLWAEGLPPLRNGRKLEPIGPGFAPYIYDADRDGDMSWPPRSPEPLAYDHATVIGMNEEAGEFAAANHRRFAPAGIRAIPSIAYRLALAAASEVDIALSLTEGLDLYDVAAGLAVLKAAGGRAIELDGTPLTFQRGATFRGCIAGRPELLRETRRRKPQAARRMPRNKVKVARRLPGSAQLGLAQGVMLGQLAGDALGSHVEFSSAETIAVGFLEGMTDILPGGYHGTLAGQPTDDSELALALARSIVAHGGYHPEQVAKAYIAWGRSAPFDCGLTIRAGIAALQGQGRANAHSQANGAMMRQAPIGIACAGRPAEAAALARRDCAMTHPHPVCQASSAAYAAAIAAGLSGANDRTIWAVAHAHAGDDEGGRVVRDWLERATSAGPDDFQTKIGWVRIAFLNAFHRLWIQQPLETAVVETVAAGGDTDTNAAICGALLGAIQGIDAVPLRWRRAVLGCRAVEGPSVRHSRAPTYWADDALDLAEALLATSFKEA